MLNVLNCGLTITSEKLLKGNNVPLSIENYEVYVCLSLARIIVD